MKEIFKNALTVICSLAFVLLLAEGVLRFLPVNEGLRTQPVNAVAPAAHFEPDRTSTWSRFADFSMVNTVHSNNYGYLNDQDYSAKAGLPLIAVIGDSYVEAAMIPYGRTFHGRLADALARSWRVYSFGVSGAPLSQYLAFADFARETFHPQKMIIAIIANDFDESLLDSGCSPGFHYFKRDGAGKLKLVRRDYSPSLARRIARRSRLAMYLLTNVRIQYMVPSLFRDSAPAATVAQTSASTDEGRLRSSSEAMDTFLRMLPGKAGLAPGDIIFVVDGMRPNLYTKEGRQKAKGSFADRMRTEFIPSALASGYQVVDMEQAFLADFAANGKRFEFERDGHWNEEGHRVVFETLMGLLQGEKAQGADE